MATFILRLDHGPGIAVAVKDLIDVRGTPTTAGSRAVAARAGAAAKDAACLAGIRAAGAQLVGKTNLHELAGGATGVNRWFGTPVNPVDARLVPGGSSSGSAVAVATGDADVAIGTDTGGSVRIPSACCGTVGLKTTWGRVPTTGVWPLAPSLDTVGPMARDVAGVVTGMELLEPGFAPAPAPADGIGRLRLAATAPAVDAAVDDALARAELPVGDVRLPGWAAGGDATLTVLLAEAWESDRQLLADAELLDPEVRAMIVLGGALPPADLTAARLELDGWKRELRSAVERCGGVIALPTLLQPPPTLADAERAHHLVLATAPINGAGFPALALPVPGPSGVPVSLQLVAAPGREDLLVATGARIEAAVRQ